MLSLIVLLGMGIVQDGDRKPTESELRSAHQMLSGIWQVVSATDNGDPLGPELIRRKVVQNGKITIANRVITHVNPETGETRTTGYMINPIKSPKEIDLITPKSASCLAFTSSRVTTWWSASRTARVVLAPTISSLPATRSGRSFACS